jgi:hypothetical protein
MYLMYCFIFLTIIFYHLNYQFYYLKVYHSSVIIVANLQADFEHHKYEYVSIQHYHLLV